MKFKVFALCLPLLLSSATFAQQIKDVFPADSNYGIISNAVKAGYLPLNSDNAFQADQPVNRKEMAFIIDKLLSAETSTELTKVQIQELLGLSKSFKSTAVQFQKIQTDLTTEQKRLDDEQKMLHADISKLTRQLASANATIDKMKEENSLALTKNTRLEELKAANADEHTTMWIAIAISIILGIVK